MRNPGLHSRIPEYQIRTTNIQTRIPRLQLRKGNTIQLLDKRAVISRDNLVPLIARTA